MTTLNVQFSDSTESTIISYFDSPQDSDQYENFGTVDTDDKRWATFYAKAGGAQCGLPPPTEAEASV
ncbi:hypothetical protein QZM35_12230 [Burkholderia sp. AU45274]|uniref:hypothetical protein n=1 Tax=Burkholderia sp. AU45274 TaxID=3059205 RepID=UPI00264F4E91|nr:hypothetical protein [Burkholderia sp. AU45274]MDN7488466.1 hypothetical protein [Burkholderia sp. AU45274]